MSWNKIEEHLFEKYCVEGEDKELCRLMKEHDKATRNKAIEEFAEKIVNRCEKVAYNTAIDGVPNVDILTLDGIVDDIWDIAEQMKEAGE